MIFKEPTYLVLNLLCPLDKFATLNLLQPNPLPQQLFYVCA